MALNRDWRRFFLIVGPLLLVAAAAAIFLPSYRNLSFLFLFTIASNSVIPAPYDPVVILLGRLYAPLLVACVAAVGTVIACFLDYRAIHYAFQNRKLQKVRQSDLYQGAVHYFLRAPFLSILVAAFAPFIPFYIFRVLSPTSGYPLKRYMLAVFIGRLPRYYLFALMGNVLIPSKLALVGGGILIVCTLLYIEVQRHLIARKDGAPGPAEIQNLSLE